MDLKSSNKIAVVGGGAIGMGSALLLDQYAIPVTLIVPPSPANAATWDPRTYALNRIALQELESLGVSTTALERYAEFEALEVWDEHDETRLHFKASDIGTSHLGIVVEHRVLLDALRERLKRSPGIEILEQKMTSIDFSDADQVCRIHLEDGSDCSASFVIGADGARSSIRRQAGIEWQPRDYAQIAQAGVVETAKPHHHHCYQQFSEQHGVAALLPLSDGKCSAIWSHQHEATADTFESFFSSAMGLGAVKLVSDLVKIPLCGGLAQDYVTERCLLIGDAAHSIHPLAGQGVNLGFNDLSILRQLMKESATQSSSPQRLLTWPLLRRYRRKTTLHNATMKHSLEMMLLASASDARFVRYARRALCAAVENSPQVKGFLMDQAGALRRNAT